MEKNEFDESNTDLVSSIPKLLKWGIRFSFLLLLIAYGFSSASRVKGVVINGTHYLDASYIEDVANIHEGSIFFCNIPFLKEMKLKKDPLIASASVKLTSNNVISITIQEKKAIGYRYEDTAEILLSDNTKAELKSAYLDIIASVPLIEGFTDKEQTRLLCKAFDAVDQNMIENIAQVTQYSLSYDDQAMQIQMRNGGYFLGNYQNLDKLNDYYEIYAKLNDKSQCISGDENANVAYSFVCPWNEADTVTEYWTNEDGSIKENQYGDKIAKHYYIDEDGNPATDASGNKIAIPIDENGSEVIDPNFNRNYAEGYYATGELVLPEGVSNDPEPTPTPEVSDENETPE